MQWEATLWSLEPSPKSGGSDVEASVTTLKIDSTTWTFETLLWHAQEGKMNWLTDQEPECGWNPRIGEIWVLGRNYFRHVRVFLSTVFHAKMGNACSLWLVNGYIMMKILSVKCTLKSNHSTLKGCYGCLEVAEKAWEDALRLECGLHYCTTKLKIITDTI